MAKAAEIKLHQSAAGFLSHVGSWLQQHEFLNHEILALSTQATNKDTIMLPTLWVTAERNNSIVGAFAYQPAVNLWLAAGTEPDVAVTMATAIRNVGFHPRSVKGPPDAARAVARLWPSELERSVETHVLQAPVVRESETTGNVLPISKWNISGFHTWFPAYHHEVGTNYISSRETDSLSQEAAEAGRLFVWMLPDKTATAIIEVEPPAARGMRITMLYTVRGNRGKGYATALAAEMCNRFFKKGASYCMVELDRNTMGTSLYGRLGFSNRGTSATYTISSQ